MSHLKLVSDQSPLQQQIYAIKRHGYLEAVKVMDLTTELAGLKVSDPQSLQGKTVTHLQTFTKYLAAFRKVTSRGIVTKYPEILNQLKNAPPEEDDPFLLLLFKQCLHLEPTDLDSLATHFEDPISTVIQIARRSCLLNQENYHLAFPSLKQDLKAVLLLFIDRDYILITSAILTQFGLLDEHQSLFLAQISTFSIPIAKQLLQDYLIHFFCSPNLQLAYQNPQEAIDCARVFKQWKLTLLIEQIFDYLVLENEVTKCQELAIELKHHSLMVKSLMNWGTSSELLAFLNATHETQGYPKNFYEKMISKVIESEPFETKAFEAICESLEIYARTFKAFPKVAKELFKKLHLVEDPLAIYQFYLKARSPFLKGFFLVLYQSHLFKVKHDLHNGLQALREFNQIKEQLHPRNKLELEEFIKDSFAGFSMSERFGESFYLLDEDNRRFALKELTIYQPLIALDYCLVSPTLLSKLDVEMFLIGLKYCVSIMTPEQIYDTCGLIAQLKLYNYLEHFAKSIEPYYLRKLFPFIENSTHFAEIEHQGSCFVECCSLIESNNINKLKRVSLRLNRQLFKEICKTVNL